MLICANGVLKNKPPWTSFVERPMQYTLIIVMIIPVQGAGPGSGPAERPPGAFPVRGTGPGSGPIERPPGASPCDTGPGGGPAERPPGVALSRAV